MDNDRSIALGSRVGVMGAGGPHRHLAWPVVERIRDTLVELGYEAVVVDLESSDYFDDLRSCDVAYIADYDRGEDGTLQGLLSRLSIPYTGSGVIASAVARNKVLTKKVLSFHDIPTPEWASITRTKDLDAQMEVVGEQLGFPLFIKPVAGGGSYGITVVRDTDEAREAVRSSADWGRVYAERFIEGPSLTCGIIGPSDDLTVFPVHELEYADGAPYLDPRAHFKSGQIQRHLPPRVGVDVAKAAQETAIRTHLAVGAHGVSRIDMQADAQGNVYVLEINTHPGMAATSDLPLAAEWSGISFKELIHRILLHASTRPLEDL